MTDHLLGRLALDEGIVAGRVAIEDGRIAAVVPDAAGASGPYVAAGFIDLHVHGWGGHDAMGGRDALAGMARALLRRGVTSFFPTAVSAPLPVLAAFVRSLEDLPTGGAQVLGANLEGPFLSPERRGAHDPRHLLRPADADRAALEPILDGVRIMTVAPELDGAPELIRWLADRGITVALGHSAATGDEARAGFAAGARSTTHLFNAMTGMEHRAPGLAGVALTNDTAAVELVADEVHVDPALYPVIFRSKPRGCVVLVSDAISLGGIGDGRGRLGALEVEVRGNRSTLVGTETIAGSVVALDAAVRNLVRGGIGLTDALAAASANPARLLGLADRGRIAVGLRADLVELDDDLQVTGVLSNGARIPG
ncbi:MAG: N-acetylglucosamine-6-phosphate deacetylase [Chloroflexota bacterium]